MHSEPELRSTSPLKKGRGFGTLSLLTKTSQGSQRTVLIQASFEADSDVKIFTTLILACVRFLLYKRVCSHHGKTFVPAAPDGLHIFYLPLLYFFARLPPKPPKHRMGPAIGPAP